MEELRRRAGPTGESLIGAQLQVLLERTLGIVCALLLLGLVAVTCLDVVGRYFFGAPLTGAFEVTELMLAALVFSALPLTTERREHVEVDLLQLALSPAVNRLFNLFAGLFSMALLTTFAWRLFSHAVNIATDGATSNALTIPLAPFGFLAAASCLLSAGVAFLRGVVGPNDGDTAPTGEQS